MWNFLSVTGVSSVATIATTTTAAYNQQKEKNGPSLFFWVLTFFSFLWSALKNRTFCNNTGSSLLAYCSSLKTFWNVKPGSRYKIQIWNDNIHWSKFFILSIIVIWFVFLPIPVSAVTSIQPVPIAFCPLDQTNPTWLTATDISDLLVLFLWCDTS